MVADPGIFRTFPPDRADADEPLVVPAARRGVLLPARPALKRERMAATDEALLDYAAFVLEQEAAYCQQ